MLPAAERSDRHTQAGSVGEWEGESRLGGANGGQALLDRLNAAEEPRRKKENKRKERERGWAGGGAAGEWGTV